MDDFVRGDVLVLKKLLWVAVVVAGVSMIGEVATAGGCYRGGYGGYRGYYRPAPVFYGHGHGYYGGGYRHHGYGRYHGGGFYGGGYRSPGFSLYLGW